MSPESSTFPVDICLDRPPAEKQKENDKAFFRRIVFNTVHFAHGGQADGSGPGIAFRRHKLFAGILRKIDALENGGDGRFDALQLTPLELLFLRECFEAATFPLTSAEIMTQFYERLGI